MDRLIRAFRATPLPGLVWRARQGWLGLARPFRLGVRILVTDEAGRVLLVRHSYRPGWHFPGGGVKRWETLADAAIRETAEEAGVRIRRLDRLVGVYANFAIGYCDHVALFTASDWQAEPAESLEVSEAQFFESDRIPSDVSPPTRRRLDEVFGGAAVALHW
ncbi:MAG: NUDIX domain-containing protein [Alphaproteobacteria bacterium]|jgi:ADP-ribose pyrophosphatase YjhB (NUDIX family)|nr:NUDIX domain-containing protein [Alphaproteobacteria bacterium]